MTMRIALITREYPPETSWGGIGTFYHAFSKSLRDAQCDVEVFTQGLSKPSSELEDGILVHRVVPRRWIIGKQHGGDLAGNTHLGVFAASLALEMHRTFSARHRKARFDIVEGHEHLGINAIINCLHKNSVATITRYHTAYHSLVSRKLVDWPNSSFIRFLEKLSLSSARFRIASSSFIDAMTQNDFAGIPKADSVIPLKVLPYAHRASTQKQPLIVFVGRMVAGHKNPDMAAKAFASLANRFPEWTIEFAGLDMPLGDGETMWRRCEKILSPHNSRFRYHGSLPRDRVGELYGRARIALIPSKFESFGLVALEAMSAGCVPIVASDTALPEVVGDAGLVFDNGSLDDLIEKLSSLMSNEQVLSSKSAAGIRRVHEVFSDQAILEKNIAFYRRAMNI